MRINIRLLSIYAFSLAIMYLAGVYFGNVLHLMFVFFCLYPVFSFISLIIWYLGLDHEQVFSTSTPVKGETIEYRVRIYNKSFLPLPSVAIQFESVSPSMEVDLPNYSASIKAGGRHERKFDIMCPYRGDYSIGINALIVSDYFQLFSIKKKVTPQSFRVFPRIVELDSFAPVARVVEGSGKNASAGIMPDPTLFQQLREYRDGDSIRHIYWKKYASTGRPILKEYERTKKSGVRIYFDTREHTWRGVNKLEQEDVSVEILVALVKFLLDRKIHTTVMAPGWKQGIYSSQEPEEFDGFYRATGDLAFLDTPSPVAIYHEDRSTGNLESQTVIFITHVIDPAIFALREHAGEVDMKYIMNACGYIRRDQLEISNLIESTKEYGADALSVHNASSIREDLSDRITQSG